MSKIAILGIGVLAIAAFFLGKSLSPKAQIPLDWQSQTNQNYGISFMLPKDWDSVEVSDSLVIAPLEIVEDLRDKIAKGFGFGGGTFLTMQVHILKEDYPTDTFQSNARQSVTKKDSAIDGNAAIEYTSEILEAGPGVEQGSVIKTYLVTVNGKKYSFTLLDKSKAETLQKILTSVKFIKPVESELIGKTKDEVKASKGEPKDTNKEVWVYLDQKDESSGTYVYFEDGKVTDVKVDEYTGTLESI